MSTSAATKSLPDHELAAFALGKWAALIRAAVNVPDGEYACPSRDFVRDAMAALVRLWPHTNVCACRGSGAIIVDKGLLLSRERKVLAFGASLAVRYPISHSAAEELLKRCGYDVELAEASLQIALATGTPLW